MPDWLKYLIGALIMLFSAGLTAWASSIKTDTEKLVDQGEVRERRLTVIEERVRNDGDRTLKIEKKIEELGPAQIRMEGKIDQILESQTQQWKVIQEIKERR